MAANANCVEGVGAISMVFASEGTISIDEEQAGLFGGKTNLIFDLSIRYGIYELNTTDLTDIFIPGDPVAFTVNLDPTSTHFTASRMELKGGFASAVHLTDSDNDDFSIDSEDTAIATSSGSSQSLNSAEKAESSERTYRVIEVSRIPDGKESERDRMIDEGNGTISYVQENRGSELGFGDIGRFMSPRYGEQTFDRKALKLPRLSDLETPLYRLLRVGDAVTYRMLCDKNGHNAVLSVIPRVIDKAVGVVVEVGSCGCVLEILRGTAGVGKLAFAHFAALRIPGFYRDSVCNDVGKTELMNFCKESGEELEMEISPEQPHRSEEYKAFRVIFTQGTFRRMEAWSAQKERLEENGRLESSFANSLRFGS